MQRTRQAVDLPDVELDGRDLSNMRYLFVRPAGRENFGTEPEKASASDWNFANLSGTTLRGATLNGLLLRHARMDKTTLVSAAAVREHARVEPLNRSFALCDEIACVHW
jgi:uncharacterized protein YjbI with pentapeptide repeats